MKLRLRAAAVAGALLITVSGGAAAFAPRPPVDSNSVTSGPAEVDPVLHTPFPQSRFLGLV
jgi:hypothetical protein